MKATAGKTIRLVGGPAAGRKVTIPSGMGDTLYLPVPPDMDAKWSPKTLPEQPEQGKTAVYKLDKRPAPLSGLPKYVFIGYD